MMDILELLGGCSSCDSLKAKTQDLERKLLTKKKVIAILKNILRKKDLELDGKKENAEQSLSEQISIFRNKLRESNTLLARYNETIEKLKARNEHLEYLVSNFEGTRRYLEGQLKFLTQNCSDQGEKLKEYEKQIRKFTGKLQVKKRADTVKRRKSKAEDASKTDTDSVLNVSLVDDNTASSDTSSAILTRFASTETVNASDHGANNEANRDSSTDEDDFLAVDTEVTGSGGVDECNPTTSSVTLKKIVPVGISGSLEPLLQVEVAGREQCSKRCTLDETETGLLSCIDEDGFSSDICQSQKFPCHYLSDHDYSLSEKDSTNQPGELPTTCHNPTFSVTNDGVDENIVSTLMVRDHTDEPNQSLMDVFNPLDCAEEVSVSMEINELEKNDCLEDETVDDVAALNENDSSRARSSDTSMNDEPLEKTADLAITELTVTNSRAEQNSIQPSVKSMDIGESKDACLKDEISNKPLEGTVQLSQVEFNRSLLDCHEQESEISHSNPTEIGGSIRNPSLEVEVSLNQHVSLRASTTDTCTDDSIAGVQLEETVQPDRPLHSLAVEQKSILSPVGQTIEDTDSQGETAIDESSQDNISLSDPDSNRVDDVEHEETIPQIGCVPSLISPIKPISNFKRSPVSVDSSSVQTVILTTSVEVQVKAITRDASSQAIACYKECGVQVNLNNDSRNKRKPCQYTNQCSQTEAVSLKSTQTQIDHFIESQVVKPDSPMLNASYDVKIEKTNKICSIYNGNFQQRLSGFPSLNTARQIFSGSNLFAERPVFNTGRVTSRKHPILLPASFNIENNFETASDILKKCGNDCRLNQLDENNLCDVLNRLKLSQLNDWVSRCDVQGRLSEPEFGKLDFSQNNLVTVRDSTAAGHPQVFGSRTDENDFSDFIGRNRELVPTPTVNFEGYRSGETRKRKVLIDAGPPLKRLTSTVREIGSSVNKSLSGLLRQSLTPVEEASETVDSPKNIDLSCVPKPSISKSNLRPSLKSSESVEPDKVINRTKYARVKFVSATENSRRPDRLSEPSKPTGLDQAGEISPIPSTRSRRKAALNELGPISETHQLQQSPFEENEVNVPGKPPTIRTKTNVSSSGEESTFKVPFTRLEGFGKRRKKTTSQAVTNTSLSFSEHVANHVPSLPSSADDDFQEALSYIREEETFLNFKMLTPLPASPVSSDPVGVEDDGNVQSMKECVDSFPPSNGHMNIVLKKNKSSALKTRSQLKRKRVNNIKSPKHCQPEGETLTSVENLPEAETITCEKVDSLNHDSTTPGGNSQSNALMDKRLNDAKLSRIQSQRSLVPHENCMEIDSADNGCRSNPGKRKSKNIDAFKRAKSSGSIESRENHFSSDVDPSDEGRSEHTSDSSCMKVRSSPRENSKNERKDERAESIEYIVPLSKNTGEEFQVFLQCSQSASTSLEPPQECAVSSTSGKVSETAGSESQSTANDAESPQERYPVEKAVNSTENQATSQSIHVMFERANQLNLDMSSRCFDLPTSASQESRGEINTNGEGCCSVSASEPSESIEAFDLNSPELVVGHDDESLQECHPVEKAVITNEKLAEAKNTSSEKVDSLIHGSQSECNRTNVKMTKRGVNHAKTELNVLSRFFNRKISAGQAQVETDSTGYNCNSKKNGTELVIDDSRSNFVEETELRVGSEDLDIDEVDIDDEDSPLVVNDVCGDEDDVEEDWLKDYVALDIKPTGFYVESDKQTKENDIEATSLVQPIEIGTNLVPAEEIPAVVEEEESYISEPCEFDALRGSMAYWYKKAAAGLLTATIKNKPTLTKTTVGIVKKIEAYCTEGSAATPDSTAHNLKAYKHKDVSRSIAKKILKGDLEDSKSISSSRHRLLSLVSALTERDPPFLDSFLDTIAELVASVADKTMEAEDCVKLATFYCQICQIFMLKHRMVSFVLDVVYARGWKAQTIVFSLLKLWPNLLPHSSTSRGDLLTTAVVVSLCTAKNNIMTKLLKTLRMCLANNYGYSWQIEKMDHTKFIEDLLSNLATGKNDIAAILYCKARGWEFSLGIMSARVVPYLSGWVSGERTFSDIHLSKLIIFLGRLSRNIPVNMAVPSISNALTILEKILSKAKQPKVIDAAVEAICHFRRHNLVSCALILRSWTPPNNSISLRALSSIWSLLRVKSPEFWTRFESLRQRTL